MFLLKCALAGQTGRLAPECMHCDRSSVKWISSLLMAATQMLLIITLRISFQQHIWADNNKCQNWKVFPLSFVCFSALSSFVCRKIWNLNNPAASEGPNKMRQTQYPAIFFPHNNNIHRHFEKWIFRNSPEYVHPKPGITLRPRGNSIQFKCL